jgi:hypothetical protein
MEVSPKTNLRRNTMALTLAEIRAKLLSKENRGSGNTGSFGDGTVYPHWNIKEGQTARIRFLPDADPKNNFFWIERQMIKLPFAGIKGQADSKPIIVQVPCIEMWPDMGMCPILTEVRTWFKDKNLEEIGRKYWKKKSYLFQGFVRENPMEEDKVPENPIRRFIISPQIFNIVKAALMDSELENLPTDYQSGLDFTVVKTSKGGYADYSTSKWSRKESALTVDEAEAIEKFSLFNLSDFLPKRPSAEELFLIKEMFDASVNGEAYDTDKWGKAYKPANFQTTSDDVPTEVATVATTDTTVAVVESAPVVTAQVDVKSTTSGSRAEEILAQIRNRQKAVS